MVVAILFNPLALIMIVKGKRNMKNTTDQTQPRNRLEFHEDNEGESPKEATMTISQFLEMSERSKSKNIGCHKVKYDTASNQVEITLDPVALQ